MTFALTRTIVQFGVANDVKYEAEDISMEVRNDATIRILSRYLPAKLTIISERTKQRVAFFTECTLN